MDSILITNLEAIGHIGVKDDERAIPQVLVINLRAKADFSKAALSDDVADAVNYSSVVKHIKKIVAETNYYLLEALSYRIIQELFDEYPVDEICIKIEKKHRVANTQYVGIEMCRKRKDCFN